MKNLNLPPIAAPLLAWYDSNKRDLPWRQNTDPYRVWVSEIMLQQTRVTAVIPYFERWMQTLPDVTALAGVDDELLMKLWQGLGYYSRARNLKKAAQVIVNEHGGEFPTTYDQLIKLPGIGEYTAGAIASIAFGERVSAVDGNVLRIAARLCDFHGDILDTRVKKFMRQVLDLAVPEVRSGDFNQSLMDLGATVCLSNGKPLCEACPLVDLCKARELGNQEELPVRAKKNPRRIEELTVYLMIKDGTVALRKRDSEGLLAGLWEFPHISGTATDKTAPDALSAWGLTVLDWKKKISTKHIFTHVEWHMTGYLVTVKGEGLSDFVWADSEKLAALAVPGAFQKYFAECMDALEEQERENGTVVF